MRILSWVVGGAGLLFCAAQAAPALSRQDRAVLPAASAPSQATISLKRGTKVEMLVVREVNSALASRGTRVELRVSRPVEVDGKVVIPEGTTGWGHVVLARGSRGLDDDPEIAIELDRIDLGNVAVPIRGGNATQGAMTMSTATGFGTSVVTYTLRWTNAKVGADAVINARYEDPHMMVVSAMKTDATGTAIRFDIPAAAATP